MKPQMRTKIALDVVITITLLLQMGYMLLGDLPHEIIGSATILLWIVHTILNRKWYAVLFTGRYPVYRTINTVVTFLLLLSVLGIAVSAVILSSYVFSFLEIREGMSFARGLHMVSVYWCFVLSSLHLGLHWSRVVKVMRRKTSPGKIPSWQFHATAIVLSGFGIYAFVKQQIGLYMFGRIMFVFFDFEQSALSFFLEYLCMLVLFASLSYYLSALLKSRAKTLADKPNTSGRR